MGAEAATQMIFFIAAMVVAAGAAGVMANTVQDLAAKTQERSGSFARELVSDITIVNDPTRVYMTATSTTFYVKNTGQETLDWYNATILLDGEFVITTPSLLGAEATFRTGAVAQYVYPASLPAGDHRVSISMENGAHDELRFRV